MSAVHPVVVVGVALLGGVVGGAVVGWTAGQVTALVEGGGGSWAALGSAVVGAAVGAFLGAAAALALLARGQPPGTRRRLVVATLVGGPLLLVVLLGIGSVLDADWAPPPLGLALAVAGSALAGRSWAVRSGAGDRARAAR